VFVAERAIMAADRFTLTGAEGRHATTVRRLAPGELVDITDGAGHVAHCVTIAARPGELDLEVRSRTAEPPPACRVTVVQAIIKGDRGELAVELMTEVGVDVIVPWAAERSIAVWRPDREDKALSRWRSTAREAAKQSRRSWFPEVTGQVSTAGLIALLKGSSLGLLLDPGAGESLTDVVLPPAGDVVLIVGPEGGVSPAEAEALAAAGATPARLGPTVLRGSTAGAVAGALVLSRRGRWRPSAAGS
jgi:16S rRNA (uracil1498-N3)-methyltransferase